MHEMAVVQGLMAILISQAKAHEIGRIACVGSNAAFRSSQT